MDLARQIVTVDGKRVTAPTDEAFWTVLNKPAGYVTSKSDPQKRSTVFELVPDRPGLTYVGRLDYLTEGVLLFTTDGDAAHRLTHPSSEVERTYVATVRGDAMTAARRAKQGVRLEDGLAHVRDAAARDLGNRLWEFEVTLAEGRNREVRRLCAALELRVERLVRTRFGPVKLGSLPAGKTRPLTAREREALERTMLPGSRLTGSK